jgi:hypothetical protein
VSPADASAEVTVAATSASLTITGSPRPMLTSMSTAAARAIPLAIRRSPSCSLDLESALYERTVPPSSTSPGMALAALPPWMRPTVTTLGCIGSISRAVRL